MRHTPAIVKQRNNYLDLRVPSRSRPGDVRQIQFWKDGGHNCNCPGYFWATRTHRFSTQCRHYKESTIMTGNNDPELTLKQVIRFLHQGGSPRRAWSMVKCMQPHSYTLGVRCWNCKLHPVICNVHPIRHSPRGTRKPLIWRLQSALYRGKRGEASRLLRHILHALQTIKEKRK